MVSHQVTPLWFLKGDGIQINSVNLYKFIQTDVRALLVVDKLNAVVFEGGRINGINVSTELLTYKLTQ